MVDYVALSSVLVSGAVAGGSLIVTYRSGREQRSHESDLAYEERAWEKKSTALFEVISSSRSLIDGLDTDHSESHAMAISIAMTELERPVAGIEAYSSTACRAEFAALRKMLREANVPPFLHEVITEIRIAKEDAIDAQDFDGAIAIRKKERETMADAAKDMVLDVSAMRQQAEALIDQARLNVRRTES